MGRKEYLGIYPRFAKEGEAPFDYKWIYLNYDSFDLNIRKGHISTHPSSLEKIQETSNFKNLGPEDKINQQLLSFFFDEKYSKGDYTMEYFENELNLAIKNLKNLVK